MSAGMASASGRDLVSGVLDRRDYAIQRDVGGVGDAHRAGAEIDVDVVDPWHAAGGVIDMANTRLTRHTAYAQDGLSRLHHRSFRRASAARGVELGCDSARSG